MTHPLYIRDSRNPAKRTVTKTRKTPYGQLGITMNLGDASAHLVVTLDGEPIETPFAQTGSVRHSFREAFTSITRWLRSSN